MGGPRYSFCPYLSTPLGSTSRKSRNCCTLCSPLGKTCSQEPCCTCPGGGCSPCPGVVYLRSDPPPATPVLPCLPPCVPCDPPRDKHRAVHVPLCEKPVIPCCRANRRKPCPDYCCTEPAVCLPKRCSYPGVPVCGKCKCGPVMPIW